jgi:CHAT domain-containing protein/Tfp pilus assembly protein PilF
MFGIVQSQVLPLLRSVFLALLPLALLPIAAHSKSRLALPSRPAQQQPPPPSGANNTAIITLEPGKVVERAISGGEKHSYRVTLIEGQAASFIVEQRGIDVLVRVSGPDGKPIAEFDDELRSQGQEKPELVATATGSYQLDLETKQQIAPKENYVIRFVELRVATDDDRTLQDSRGLFLEAARLWRAGKYDAALVPAMGAIAAREKVLGPDHPYVAAALNNLAIVYYLKGDLDKAQQLHQRILKIREKSLPPDHPFLAATLNNIAEIYRLKGEYPTAEALYRRSIAIWERSLGPDHPVLALPITNLAIVRRVLGDYAEAEALYLRAIAIRENALGPDHIDVASSINNLGTLYMVKGDLTKAEEMLQRALQILEHALGPDHPRVATALTNLGSIAHDRGNLDKAEQLYRRALEIWRKGLGPDHPNFAIPLDGLATVLYDRGDLDGAEPLMQHALEIREKALGPEHPDVATSLNNLAKLYSRRGNFAKAEEFYQRALKIREKTLGPEHPDVSELLNNMATFYAARGDSARAIATQAQANAIIEHNIALNVLMGSERQKLAYLDTLSELNDRTISLHIKLAPDNRAARELAVTTILQRKGRVQDAMSDGLASLRRRFNPQDQQLLDQLNDTTGRLARLVLNGPQKISLAEHQRQIATLEEQKEQIENEISRRSSGFYTRSEPATVKAVQAAIPAQGALIEISTYRPFDPNAVRENRKPYGETRYVAYVLRHEGEVQWEDLGETRSIDEAINALRRALRDPKRNDVRQLARALDQKVMLPVRALAGDATQLLVSPDGQLNLIPFEALVDEHEQYLVEHYSFTYLTSGRDLLRMRVAQESKSHPLVIANPSFGEPAAILLAKASTGARTSGARDRRRPVTSSHDWSDIYFAPLEGSAREARTIEKLLPEASVLTEAQATETAIKQASAPSILHIATHGFFLQDAGPAGELAQSRTRGINVNARIENPLLRSGLALAGANLHSGGNEDGILTAMEASGLNLWGTKLVVLSACDTGVGEVRNGEGVYGLRRAFVLAGAQSMVMSLWPVSDYLTRTLMTNYYRNLTKGLGRGDSLRQVQLEMLKRDPKQHPYYWANFIQSGEWANLEGKR